MYANRGLWQKEQKNLWKKWRFGYMDELSGFTVLLINGEITTFSCGTEVEKSRGGQ